MINFTKVRWKNFVATGDYFNEVDLQRSNATLIVGENGAGKSTMLDALSFGLFGKPFRNTNKPELVNSINKKQAIVEVEFDIGPHSYKVVRGLKPVKFEIWRDEVMMDQSSHAKEFQKMLEQNILKLNHKSFHQIVVIGSSSFVPFMQLPAAARREIIEDLLDINIFTKMNAILRDKSSTIKDQLKENDSAIRIIDNKMGVQRQYIEDLKKINSEDIAKKKQRIAELEDELDVYKAKLDSKTAELEDDQFVELDKRVREAGEQMRKLERLRASVNEQMKTLVKQSKFFEENDTCPTCDQVISAEIRDSKKSTHLAESNELQDKHSKCNHAHEQGQEHTDRLREVQATMQDIVADIKHYRSTTDRINSDIRRAEQDMSKANDNKDSILSANDDLNDIINEKSTLADTRLELTDQQSYNQAIAEMLKDGGIKTKIIKQYLPVMNKLINKYLNILDFFVQFELNQEFVETIRSRYRDNFTYGSFSEGEKQRIDLALLFTWRHIARMKNSVATNLLVLDETFDSSLDSEGTENLMKIMDTLEDGTNAFVISHKGLVLENRFNNKIEFYKDKNFSRMR